MAKLPVEYIRWRPPHANTVETTPRSSVDQQNIEINALQDEVNELRSLVQRLATLLGVAP